MNKTVSLSRTYVVMCSSIDCFNYSFKKFTLPEEYENNSDSASWYFTNRLDLTSYIEGCISFEDFSNVIDLTRKTIPSGWHSFIPNGWHYNEKETI